MPKTLYVGNIPYSFTKEKLQDLFAQQGNVLSTTVIENPYTHRSKGFGFVVMATEEDAKKAKSALDGKELEGRKIIVNDARSQEKPNREGFRFQRGDRFRRPAKRGRPFRRF